MTSDAPRWLDEVEMRIWRSFLLTNGRVLRQLNEGLKGSSDLSLDDYEVLVHLSEHQDRRLRMTELSDRLVNSQSRLSQRVDRLVARGYVVREKCPDDRRGTFAVLTEAGFDALEAAAPAHLEDVRRLIIDLVEPEERLVVADVLERIAHAARDSAD